MLGGMESLYKISNVLEQMIKLVEESLKNVPLVLTDGHGYLYLGDNPTK